jgi:hypothetical protein
VKAGIYTLDATEYHADAIDKERPSLSASIAHLLISQTPRHAWTAHPRLNPDYAERHEDRFDVGTVAHALLLERRSVEEACVIVEAADWRTNAAKDARAEARADGKIALLAKQVEDVVAMLRATHEQLDAHDADPPLFDAGECEQTLVWKEDGITCRSRVDWLRNDHAAIDDLKTTSASADPTRWSRTLFSIGSDVQTAFHLRGVRALTGTDAVMRYVVQETYPPYALSVCALGPAALAVGNDKVERAIALWRECLARDEWPAYPTEIAYAELPPWEEARWLEREEAVA